MTNAALIRTLARALRAAAVVLEQAEDEERFKPPPKVAEITDLDRARAQRVLDEMGMG